MSVSVSSSRESMAEIEADLSRPLVCGWLKKRGKWNTSYKKRWFYFEQQSRRLYYSAGPQKVSQRAQLSAPMRVPTSQPSFPLCACGHDFFFFPACSLCLPP